MNKLSVITLFISLVLLSGCSRYNEFDKIAKTKWNPELAVPLVNSEISIEQILVRNSNYDLLDIGDDNFISLIYKDEFSSETGIDILNISELTSTLTELTNRFYFDFNGFGDIRELHVSSGSFHYFIPNVSEELIITITMPFVDSSGVPFSQTFTVNGSSNSGSFDLAGFIFDLTSNGVDINSVEINYEVIRSIDGVDVTANFDIDFRFKDILFSFVKGYFGALNFDIQNNNIPISIFKNWKKGEVRLENPQLSFNFSNSFGFPIKGSFATLQGTGTATQAIESDEIDNGFPLNYSDLDNPTFENTVINLDKDNSNIQNFIAVTPKSIKYAMNFTGNVELDTTELDFMFDDSEFNLDFRLTLPMHGKISEALLLDTINFSLDAEELFFSTETAIFKLQTENKLPVDASLQLYFLNKENEILDSLILDNQQLLEAGDLDEEGIVIAPNSVDKLIEYNILANDNEAVKNAKKIMLKVKLEASNNGESVKLYSDYYIKVKLGVMAKVQL